MMTQQDAMLAVMRDQRLGFLEQITNLQVQVTMQAQRIAELEAAAAPPKDLHA